MSTTAEVVETVCEGLQVLILQNLKGVAQQQYFPCANPDETDERIAAGKEAAAKLRELRTQFEDIVTGVL